MADEPKQKFHQFPLGCLKLGTTPKEKTEFMIAWGTIEAGRRVEASIGDPHVIKDKIGPLLRNKHAFSQWENRAWALGKNVVGLSWHDSPSHCVSLYRQMQMSNIVTHSPYVRVMNDLMTEAYNGQFEFRDFAVLCSLYAIIGDKQYCVAHRDRMRAGALGYSKPSAIFDRDGNVHEQGEKFLESRADKARPITTNQIRHTLNKLHNRRFFTRLQPWANSRSVYYSRSLSHEELADRLVLKIEKRLTATGEQGSAQDAFRQKAASLLKRLTSGATAESPGDHQSATAGVTGDVTAGPTALIDAGINKCLPNEFPPNECRHKPQAGVCLSKDEERELERMQRKELLDAATAEVEREEEMQKVVTAELDTQDPDRRDRWQQLKQESGLE